MLKPLPKQNVKNMNKKKLEKEQIKNSPEYKGKIGMILGICCIIFMFTGIVPLILFIPGLVFSAKGLKAEKNGQAIAGLICNGIIFLVIVVALIYGIVHFCFS